MNLAKKISVGGIILILGLVLLSSFARGENLKKDKVMDTYYDSQRDSYLRITVFPKAIDLYSKNLGNQKMKLISETETEKYYQSQKVDLSLTKKDGLMIVLAGDKEVFEGKLDKVGILENRKKTLLIANDWTWENLVTSGDTYLKPVQGGIFNLSFTKEEKVKVSTECANFIGDYKLEGEKISITDFNVVGQTCDNLGGEDFVKFLNGVDEFTFDNGGNLVFFFRTNDASMSFLKK